MKVVFTHGYFGLGKHIWTDYKKPNLTKVFDLWLTFQSQIQKKIDVQQSLDMWNTKQGGNTVAVRTQRTHANGLVPLSVVSAVRDGSHGLKLFEQIGLNKLTAYIELLKKIKS